MRIWGDSHDSHDDEVLGRTYLYPMEREALERKRWWRRAGKSLVLSLFVWIVYALVTS